MTAITPNTGKAVEEAGESLGIVRFVILVAELAVAAVKLRNLSAQVRATYNYVEGCADGVERLADRMAELEVDAETLAEHRDAAAVMRSVLDEAEAMAAATEELATLFQQASDTHQAEYGSVNDAVQSMSVPMAKSPFYSNR